MPQYILRYRGKGAASTEDLQKIKAAPGLRVIDEASPRMMLVEGSAEACGRLTADLSSWIASEQQTYQLPDPRRKIAQDHS